MSIVGTRPPLISETNLYEPRHKARLAIKPGITGMWQVSGRSDITDFEEVVRLDKEYIENWDIGLDIKILLKTVMVAWVHNYLLYEEYKFITELSQIKKVIFVGQQLYDYYCDSNIIKKSLIIIPPIVYVICNKKL